MKKCDIIIPVWNELDATKKCIKSLEECTAYPHKFIIVDNGSSDSTRKYLDKLKKTFSDFTLIRNNSNLGFVKAVNQGILASRARYLCILNNDVYVTKNWLKNLIKTIELAPKTVGMANPTSNVFGAGGKEGKIGEYQELDSCKGFCMVIKNDVIRQVGLFDEIYGMGYYEEKDFSRKAVNLGFKCIKVKSSFVYHEDKLSFNKIKDRDEIFRTNENIYNKRWGVPLNIAIVAEKSSELKKIKDKMYTLLKKGHRIHIFFKKRNGDINLKDHINIKKFSLVSPLFKCLTFFKIWKRRKKKKIEIIVVLDDKNVRAFKKLRFLHKAEIFDGRKETLVPYCNLKSKR